jgi:murein L,D-transpeptidase YcbB/YkuD
MGYLKSRSTGIACAVGLFLLTSAGCHRHRKSTSAPKSEEFAGQLRPLVANGQIPGMHTPALADYLPLVQTFYDDRNFEVAWVNPKGRGEEPSPQAAIFIQAFEQSPEKGLNPQDYDADLWPARIKKLNDGNPGDVAQFDGAMTVCVMRYLSDLHIGRVNPTHFNFDINNQGKKYDLPEFLSDNVVDSDNVPGLIHSVEPDNDVYRGTENALIHYLALARQQAATPALQQPLPTVNKPLAAGAQYSAVDPLAWHLALEGDLPAQDAPPLPAAALPPAAAPARGAKTRFSAAFHRKASRPQSAAQLAQTQPVPTQTIRPANTSYTRQLATAVQHFQAHHGIPADGKLNSSTIAALNLPLTVRVNQLGDSLERWRWLPDPYINAPLMVNLPEFVLRGYSADGPNHTRDFTMKVVVGKVVGEHQTPVFTHMMKFLIFRPYWNLPDSIIKKELSKHLDKKGIGYLSQHNFETVDRKGNPVKATVGEVEHGNVVVREKPGPTNSLGLVKFMFPNQYDIYLHSTPTPELFNRSRRDFSHGCIRVQQPDQLAVWALHNTPGDWDLQKVQDAMLSGPDSHTVSLKQPIPIVIFYVSANIGDDGQVQFFPDLYDYDKQLEQVLAKGRPYPTQQQAVTPNNTSGDTT